MQTLRSWTMGKIKPRNKFLGLLQGFKQLKYRLVTQAYRENHNHSHESEQYITVFVPKIILALENYRRNRDLAALRRETSLHILTRHAETERERGKKAVSSLLSLLHIPENRRQKINIPKPYFKHFETSGGIEICVLLLTLLRMQKNDRARIKQRKLAAYLDCTQQAVSWVMINSPFLEKNSAQSYPQFSRIWGSLWLVLKQKFLYPLKYICKNLRRTYDALQIHDYRERWREFCEETKEIINTDGDDFSVMPDFIQEGSNL